MTDEAHASIEVEIEPVAAFDVFTRETGAWWRTDRVLHDSTRDHSTQGPITFEPGVGGVVRGGDVEVGRVKVWEPGPRLVFGYGDTDVEVRFEAIETGTRVVLRHYGWNAQEGHWQRLLAGFARHSLEQALLGRLGEFLDAIGAGDVDFFERNLTEDALLIFPGPGQTYTKRECVESMRDHPPYLKYDLSDPKIVHIGESAAVLSYHATVMNTADPRPKSVVVTAVLVRESGAWRMALNQWTPTDERE
jgi:uncharacterized protein DUF4440